MPSFKNFVIHFLISTSYDYATRSVPLGETKAVTDKVKAGERQAGTPTTEADMLSHYAEIFQSMKLWHESSHPFVFFNQTG
jgi:hypothetical protein